MQDLGEREEVLEEEPMAKEREFSDRWMTMRLEEEVESLRRSSRRSTVGGGTVGGETAVVAEEASEEEGFEEASGEASLEDSLEEGNFREGEEKGRVTVVRVPTTVVEREEGLEVAVARGEDETVEWQEVVSS